MKSTALRSLAARHLACRPRGGAPGVEAVWSSWVPRGFHILLALIFALLPAVGSADILKWIDDTGVTHYTNLKGEVPAQESVEVVVDETVWVPAVSETSRDPVAPPQDPVAPPPVPYDSVAEVRSAYLAGLSSGLATNVSSGGSVYISGPLAVSVAAPPADVGYVNPGYGWWAPGYYPFLVTSVIGRHSGALHGQFGRRFPPSRRFTSAAGPPPHGAAGRPPVGAAGGSLLRVSGGRSVPSGR